MAAYMLPFLKKQLNCFVLMDSEDKFLLDLGLKIRELRENKGYSQQELADLADVAKSTIQRIEKGKYNASIILLRRVGQIINFKIIEF